MKDKKLLLTIIPVGYMLLSYLMFLENMPVIGTTCLIFSGLFGMMVVGITARY